MISIQENTNLNADNQNDYILEFRNITKRFPGVKALSDVNFGIKRGTVHVIVGENGAGKSTLLKIINGLYTADEGMAYYDNKPLKVNGPADALQAGISMIYQELNIIPEMTVLENMYLGREIKSKASIFIDTKKMTSEAESYMESQGLKFNLKDKMKNLSIAEAQMLEITKAVSANAKIILMDEPTSSLTEKEFKYLMDKIFELKEQGITIIYISHKMEEIFQVGDYITVLRDGEHINTLPAAETDMTHLVEMIVGRKMTEIYPPKICEIGETVLEVKDFSREGVFENINFTLKRGEILGMSGLIGAGRTEIARAMIAADDKNSGQLFLNGKEVSITSIDKAIENGIVMVPEDRRNQGLVISHAVNENISLVAYKHVFHSMFIKHKEVKEMVDEMIAKLSIKTPTKSTLVSTLSGGNQQKVVLGKWLSVSPSILILDEPTRGIDVGTKYEIYKLMHEMCNNGVSIILIDSDLEELMGMSDRVVVISDGKLAGTLEKDEINATSIMNYAVGGH